jgi:hypothetical protein
MRTDPLVCWQIFKNNPHTLILYINMSNSLVKSRFKALKLLFKKYTVRVEKEYRSSLRYSFLIAVMTLQEKEIREYGRRNGEGQR